MLRVTCADAAVATLRFTRVVLFTLITLDGYALS